jgi:fructuronate reductase
MRVSPLTANLPYDRETVRPGIVRIGVGAFFRAHAATYIDGLLALDPSWGVIGVSMRRPGTRDALAPQGFCYTVAVRGPEETEFRIVGSLLDILDASDHVAAVLATLSDPRIRIVSLTVT